MRLTSDWWGKTIWREWMALDMGVTHLEILEVEGM